jgi:hypothetical protein
MPKRKKRTELSELCLRWTGVEPQFTKDDNRRAWAAIFATLADPRFRNSGLRYELLARKARNACSSVGASYINYCEELGYLQIADDAKRALLRPGEAPDFSEKVP